MKYFYIRIHRILKQKTFLWPIASLFSHLFFKRLKNIIRSCSLRRNRCVMKKSGSAQLHACINFLSTKYNVISFFRLLFYHSVMHSCLVLVEAQEEAIDTHGYMHVVIFFLSHILSWYFYSIGSDFNFFDVVWYSIRGFLFFTSSSWLEKMQESVKCNVIYITELQVRLKLDSSAEFSS